jgi:RNA recognition motif-containing protein
LAGKITWFDLQLDNEGKTKGMAIIQFSHPIEAVQAISMLNNQRLFDRTLSVKMDRFDKEVERNTGELPTGLRSIGMGLGANGQPLANVTSVLSSIANFSGAAVAPAPQPTVQPFIQPINGNPSFANQSFSQAPISALPAVNPAMNGSFGNNSMNANGDVASMGYVQPQPMQQPQQPSAYSGNSFFNNNPAPQPINNGPPMMVKYEPNNSYTNSNPNNSYAKMSPQVNNYGQPSSQNKPYYDNQPSRVILIKNLPIDYNAQIVSDRVQRLGEVENVEIISPGVAKVRYVRVADAERTKAQLSGTTVEGRIIAVEYL